MSAPIKKCASCGARIVWMLTSARRRMPIDADTVEFDELTTDEATCLPLFDAELGHVSHFATCPNASKHRRKPG